MTLVIEGPDCVGKTTAIDRMVLRSGMKRDKCGLPEASYVGPTPWLDRIKPWTIMDRFTLSEPIYGLEARGKSNLTQFSYARVDQRLTEIGGQVIVVCATPDAYERILSEHYDATREAFSKDICRNVNANYLAATYKTWLWPTKIDRFWRIMLMNDRLVRPPDSWWDQILTDYSRNQAFATSRQAIGDSEDD